MAERVNKAMTPKRQGEVILLLGRVGSGKTTFVDHFLRLEMKKLFQEHLIISMDFRQYQPEENLRSFFFEHNKAYFVAHREVLLARRTKH
jgi:ABC-type polar amino acid transport system ATPase subunit